jgi:hypothetical protein
MLSSMRSVVPTLAILVILLLAVAPVRAQASPDPCAAPPDLMQAVNAEYARGKLVTLADLSESDKKDFQTEAKRKCPGLAALDFYGDGKPTYAVELVWRQEKYPTTKVVIAHKVEDKWNIRLLGTAQGLAVVTAAEPGSYESVYKDKKIVAPHPTLMFRDFGSFLIVYAWVDGRIDKVWLQD